MTKQQHDFSEDSKRAALVVTWFLLLLILGTIAGVWVKVFWLGWVMR